MLKTILIGLDGSAYSDSAVELGMRWARRFDALLVGLGVIDEPTIRRAEPVPLGAAIFKHLRDEELAARARRRVEQFLERFALRCLEAGVAAKLLEEVGLPHEQILLEAQRYDLILLGQQTYFHFATQESPCATLQKLLKCSPRPVVTVPGRLSDGRSVVIAYDGSLPAARALQAFEASGLGAEQGVHVVSVDRDRAEASRRAERAAEFLRFHGLTAHVHALDDSAGVAESILERARALDAGLLVLGAYGQPTLREFFLGSVTRSLVRESTIPLFLYH
ncbi:MAG: universal stress protein [Gemmataceae bacterium]|nr:universal stress protein [Gemmataceae bacterium]